MIFGPEVERFWAKVDKSGACWLWTGSTTRKGYGLFRTSVGGRPAHRISYSLANGGIGAGMLVDHTCFVHHCVNPEHLREVTPKQNGENRQGVSRSNRSGVRGVCWARRHKKWIGLVGHNGTQVFVGYFDDLGEAERAVIAKRNELHTHNDLDRAGV